ncbi:hypothetical protein RhiLY_02765 [Ceratobasidium sp. AG-Ba]|nr:hypothetical protein RhiLY_02765 [Ceratobasidium sp. AG-Ba]
MSTLEPPQQTPGSVPLEDEILPGYTSSREPHVHLTSIPGRNGSPWLTLRLLSDAPAGSKTPMYFNGGSVRGSAEIDLKSGQTVRSVVIEVSTIPYPCAPTCNHLANLKLIAKLCLATIHGQPLLWQERKTLWEPGGSYIPAPTTLGGSWKWDFDIPIPHCFDDSPSGGSKSAPLPGSFDLKPVLAYLEYHAFVYVKRGKRLPTEHEAHTQFIYVVRERAPQSSRLREIAYSEQRAPPGPAHDPNGWEACSEIIAAGFLFGDRKATPYLSKPSIYPRGGTVFYHIDVLSDDSQALQLMSSPSAISVSLNQEVQYSPFGTSIEKAAGKKQIVVDVHPVANGVSWASSSAEAPSGGTRMLEGEISVPSRSILNIDMSALKLRYFVNFIASATGFVATNPSLMSVKHPVRIVSHRALGPPPTSRVPPGYEPEPILPRNGLAGGAGGLSEFM